MVDDTMPETREFSLAAVLTGMTGLALTRNAFDVVWPLLNWMTDDNLFTHQLPRAIDECEPTLRATFPELSGIIVPNFTSWDEADRWLTALANAIGATREVPRLPAGVHQVINPVSELLDMRQGKPVIVLQATGGE